MKKIYLIAICISYSFTYAQQVEWVRKTNLPLSSLKFQPKEQRVYFTTHTSDWNLHFGNQVFPANFNSPAASFDKNGVVQSFVLFPLNWMPNDVIKTKTGYIFAGTKAGRNHYCLGKIDLTGQMLWYGAYYSKRPAGHTSTYYPNNEAVCVQKVNNSIYVSGVYKDSIQLGTDWIFGGQTVFSKINPATGQFIFSKSIPGAGSAKNNLCRLGKNSFYLFTQAYGNMNYAGSVISFSTNGAVLVKLDTNGNITNAYKIGDRLKITCVTSDNEKYIYAAGHFVADGGTIGTYSYPTQANGFFVLKINDQGNIVWHRVFNGTMKSSYAGDIPQMIYLGSQNFVYLTGQLSSDSLYMDDGVFARSGMDRNALLMRFDESGNEKTLFCLNDAQSVGVGITGDDNGSVYWSCAFQYQVSFGNTTLSGPGAFIVKLAGPELALETNCRTEESVNVYPVPASSEIHFNSSMPVEKIELFNQLGSACLRCANTTSIHVGNLASGIYYAKIYLNGGVITKKLIVE